MAAKFHQDGKHLDFTAVGTEVTGDLIEIAGGVGIVDPKADGTDYEAGDLGSVTVYGIVELDNSGVAFSDGGLVGYDATAKDAVATTTGDFDVGTSVGDAGSSGKVLVWLNQGL